jgi:hypothetical protein
MSIGRLFFIFALLLLSNSLFATQVSSAGKDEQNAVSGNTNNSTNTSGTLHNVDVENMNGKRNPQQAQNDEKEDDEANKTKPPSTPKKKVKKEVPNNNRQSNQQNNRINQLASVLAMSDIIRGISSSSSTVSGALSILPTTYLEQNQTQDSDVGVDDIDNSIYVKAKCEVSETLEISSQALMQVYCKSEGFGSFVLFGSYDIQQSKQNTPMVSATPHSIEAVNGDIYIVDSNISIVSHYVTGNMNVATTVDTRAYENWLAESGKIVGDSAVNAAKSYSSDLASSRVSTETTSLGGIGVATTTTTAPPKIADYLVPTAAQIVVGVAAKGLEKMYGDDQFPILFTIEKGTLLRFVGKITKSDSVLR